MMETRAAFVRVGLLIVLGIVLALALIWFLTGEQIRGGTLFETYFSESVQGLQVGSNVQYRGVTIGRVTDIGLASAEYGGDEANVRKAAYRLVYVRFVVDMSKVGPVPSVPEAVKLGLRVRLGTQLITGLAYIDLDFVDPTRYPVQSVPWTPKGAYVPSIPSAIQQVQNAGQEVLAKLNKVDLAELVTSLTSLSEALQEDLKSGDLHTTLKAAQDLMVTADHSVKDADLPGLAANLRKTSDSLRAIAENPDMNNLLSNGALATQRLGELTGRMGSLVTALEATVRQTQAGVSNLQVGLAPILRNLSSASDDLRALANSLRQYPAQVLSAPPPPTRGPLK